MLASMAARCASRCARCTWSCTKPPAGAPGNELAPPAAGNNGLYEEPPAPAPAAEGKSGLNDGDDAGALDAADGNNGLCEAAGNNGAAVDAVGGGW